ncbi:hypothetical protein CERSUDRAFT_120390 [Gelatoporia subvermispora B]|uniref:Methyltransferase type 11 domain-containing protein n=1 Tax=Ceriporiopsis subvermispora (strain B) TaxID=914234 RepID=M2QVB4_CERS8|nr:hypothetical protein CERSUDRAFT_120390 [Gelatoporia subvermispora B]
MRGRFDLVSLFYLLHCLPGSFPTEASHVLAPGGVVCGATILGRAAPHNWFGRTLVDVYSRRGVFGNAGDTKDDPERALRAAFAEVTVEQVGVVVLFSARKPIPARPRVGSARAQKMEMEEGRSSARLPNDGDAAVRVLTCPGATMPYDTVTRPASLASSSASFALRPIAPFSRQIPFAAPSLTHIPSHTSRPTPALNFC